MPKSDLGQGRQERCHQCASIARSFLNDPPDWFPLVVLFDNQILFAFMHVLVTPALAYIPPLSLALMRVSLATPFLFLLGWKEGSLHHIGRKDTKYLLALGLTGVALPQTLVLLGDKLAGPAIVSIMQPASPIYASLFAWSLGLEKLTRLKSFGIFLAVIGAIVILRPDRMQFKNDSSIGILLMIVQTMSYAVFLVMLRIKLATHPYPIGIYAHASFWGMLFIALFGLISNGLGFDTQIVPLFAWGAVLYAGLIVSFFAHACQAWAVGVTSASLPALYSCLAPFTVGFLSYLILHTSMGSASDCIGLALNVAGLIAVIYSRARLEGPDAVAMKGRSMSGSQRIAGQSISVGGPEFVEASSKGSDHVLYVQQRAAGA